MASSVTTPSVSSKNSAEERREWIRIDDRVLLEYHLRTGAGTVDPVGTSDTTPETISAAVTKPTADLLARAGESLTGSSVLPWIMKVDYLLEVILNALAAAQPLSVAMARPMDVNLSGGGVGFVSPREFAAGDELELKLILPPFILIRSVVRVIRSVVQASGQGFAVATEFVDLKSDDQEHLIRHVLHTQAERLRARRNHTGEGK
jgi:hypothetical protein